MEKVTATVIIQRSPHNTINVFLYTPFQDVINWFRVLDVWGSHGEQREDGAIRFEIPMFLWDVLNTEEFICNMKRHGILHYDIS